MRGAIPVILCAALAGGCAHRPERRAERERSEGDRFADARPAAAALVFDPPLAYDGPPLELAREGRGPEAFVGYPEGVAEHFYLRWDDRQSNWGGGRHGGGNYDHFERRAVSEKVGSIYR